MPILIQAWLVYAMLMIIPSSWMNQCVVMSNADALTRKEKVTMLPADFCFWPGMIELVNPK